MQQIATQVFGFLMTIFGGLILNRVKYQNKLSEQNNLLLKRLEILFEVKIPPMESDIKELKTNVLHLQTKLPRR